MIPISAKITGAIKPKPYNLCKHTVHRRMANTMSGNFLPKHLLHSSKLLRLSSKARRFREAMGQLPGLAIRCRISNISLGKIFPDHNVVCLSSKLSLCVWYNEPMSTLHDTDISSAEKLPDSSREVVRETLPVWEKSFPPTPLI